MTDRSRNVMFAVSALGLVALLLMGFWRLPASGRFEGSYGRTLSGAARPERHVTDVVSAINFDYRAIDTLGEEFILFASVMGVVALLRGHKTHSPRRDGDDDKAPGRPTPPTSDAVRLLGVGVAGVTVMFGLYVVTHGQLTPGGGFQGGVVLATVPLLVYLCASTWQFARVAPEWLIEAGEAAGALGFLVIGALGVSQGAYLRNVLPLGGDATVFSGGSIPWTSWFTGLEVAGGFVLLLRTFLQETIERDLHGEENDG